MSASRLLPFLCLALLSACSSAPSGSDAPKTGGDVPPAPSPIGGDRDPHGCLVGAGYSWCEREHDCVRSWELAKDKGFENSAEGYKAYCDAPASK